MNKTQINSELQSSLPTVINSQSSPVTDLNPHIKRTADALNCGDKIGEFTIVKPLDVNAGEANLYLCNKEDLQFIAKVYRRKIAIKSDVIDAVKAIDSPYIAKIFDSGTVGDMPYEILHYYENGSLSGKKYTLEQLANAIIPALNDGIHILHKSGIIHKDLKPSNVMLCDDGIGIAIIDFGISSIMEDCDSVIVTKTGMTPEYSAPETFRNVFLEESDYYSLGITLYELYFGHTPYANMSRDQIEQYISVQRIPFPETSDPACERLYELISALTYYDITHRKNKDNPNRRWTHDEVSRWLSGESLIRPGEGVGLNRSQFSSPYRFKDHDYYNQQELSVAIASDWKQGKKELYRGKLSAFFSGSKTGDHCTSAENAARQGENDDVCFFKLIYLLNPRTTAFYWKDINALSLSSFGNDILDKLRSGNYNGSALYAEILSLNILSTYIQSTNNDHDLVEATSAIETAFIVDTEATERAQLLHFFSVGYLLSGQKICKIDTHELRTVEEFCDYLKLALDLSLENFQTICHSLIDYNGNLQVQLEAWLIAIGKRAELTQWRANLGAT